MKTNFLTMLSYIAIVATTTSCYVSPPQSKQITEEYRSTQTRSYEPTFHTPFVTPLVADVKVLSQERVTATFTHHIKNISSLSSARLSNLKAQDLSDLARDNDADMIVAPTYDVVAINDGVDIKITISGYPAKYVNWRTAKTEADLELLNNFYGSKFGVQTSVVSTSLASPSKASPAKSSVSTKKTMSWF